VSLSCAEIAARIHADMVNDNDNGYSWAPRHGEDGKPVKVLTIDGKEYSYDRGSWDCSSSVIKAWQEAIKHTKYKGKLDGATYTGNMRDVFIGSGLFYASREPAKRGDVYLNDASHTAMCQDGGSDGVLGYDALSEFCINESGGVYGGKPGDQTGKEAYIHAFYEYPWNTVLHYNGKADEKKQEKPAKATAKKLNGIDIASYQDALAPSKMATTDFIIVKATGGASYHNPGFKKHADQTLAAGKLLGCYHFACEYGVALKPEQEADYFLSAVQPYVGKATLWLDYEMDALDNYSPAWCKKWLDRVKAKTGATPGIYMSKSACNSRDWAAVAKEYPLWVAQYPNYDETGYKDEPWTDSTGFGAWKAPTIFQYTSSGKIPGYSAHLDLDLFHGDKEAWMALAKNQTPKPDPKWPDGTYVVAIAKAGIRERRSTASKLCCTAAKGARIKLAGLKANKAGNVWGEIASGDHKGRFVMVYSAANKVNRLKLEHG
jgi:GH25 family lysozyme M1 (1,4-beta-N-acetylmuramidase)